MIIPIMPYCIPGFSLNEDSGVRADEGRYKSQSIRIFEMANQFPVEIEGKTGVEIHNLKNC